MKVPTEEQTKNTIKQLRNQLRADRKKQPVKDSTMASNVTPQVQELPDNYTAEKKKRDEMRTEYLAVRKSVREKHTMLKTLVQFGVVPADVLGKDDEDEKDETPENGDE